ncbi:hypothetical protein ACA910_000145 [Epithemia clementina (nom. ined.)]
MISSTTIKSSTRRGCRSRRRSSHHARQPSSSSAAAFSTSATSSSTLSGHAVPFPAPASSYYGMINDVSANNGSSSEVDDEREMEYYANVAAATAAASSSSVQTPPPPPLYSVGGGGTGGGSSGGTAAAVRYVNIRVAIPADGSSPMLPLEYSNPSPMTVTSHSTTSPFSPLPPPSSPPPFNNHNNNSSSSSSGGSKVNHHLRSTIGGSPYGFVPIPPQHHQHRTGGRDQYPHGSGNKSTAASNGSNSHSNSIHKRGGERPTSTGGIGRASTTPPASPYDFKMSRSPWTVATENTTLSDTPASLVSLETTATTTIHMSPTAALAVAAPPLYQHHQHHHQHQSHPHQSTPNAPIYHLQSQHAARASPSPSISSSSSKRIHHQHYHSNTNHHGRDSPRPKTPNSVNSGTASGGRKSPFSCSSNSSGNNNNNNNTSSNNNNTVQLIQAANAGEDDLVRKTRLKTELCMHYRNGRPCPFGANCTYAHGEEELQMTKLMDLHDAGLVDVETFRTRPCLTWVATGSCPFGKRCSCIHDPRVEGSYPSWLTHTETQGNTIATDINVDGLFQKNQKHVHYGTPFGDQFSLQHDTWSDLYRKVCNLDYSIGARGGSSSSLSSPSPRSPSFFGDCSNNNSHTSSPSSSSTWIVEPSTGRRRKTLHPICKLKIALLMRGSNPDWQYKYRPKHVIHDELCMVLQKRAFCIQANILTRETVLTHKTNGTTNAPLYPQSYTFGFDVKEIPVGSLNTENPNHVMVHELAFGPDSDPQVSRPASLWFNIDEQKVVECSSTQAKRFRWKRGINKKDSPVTTKSLVKLPPHQSVGNNTNNNNNSQPGLGPSSAFNFMENFVMIRPYDRDAYELTTAILEHRVAVITRELIPNMKERFEALKETDVTKELLQRRFENLRKHWIAWSWPVNSGREKVTKRTPVPPVDGKYQLPPPPPPMALENNNKDEKEEGVMDHSFDTENTDPAADDTIHAGSQVRRVWDSFVRREALVPIEDENCSDLSLQHPFNKNTKDESRLSIFRKLAFGLEQDQNRCLPHIQKSSITFLKRQEQEQQEQQQQDECIHADANDDDSSLLRQLSYQQERCWKSILLLPEDDDDLSGEKDEWSIVRDHFANSRSKKVLSIIQQK